MADLRRRSIEVIRAGQAPSGAYVACPTYPTYNFAWFRDGAFTARAAERWGDAEGASRFYRWACRLVAACEPGIEACIRAVADRHEPDTADLLHTRYTLDGQPGSGEWPNFQLDGFGTLLWGIEQHRRAGAQSPGEDADKWSTAVRLLVRYLAALWQHPNYDCWEEFPDRIAVSTLATIYAGLRAAATMLDPADGDAVRAGEVSAAIRAYVQARGTLDGHLIKHVDGADMVDASLLWACIPFGEHALFSPTDPTMTATVRRMESDLIGAGGGVHRYPADTFYGGGEWALLTALLGQYYVRSGSREQAGRCLRVVEDHADTAGNLPEQWSTAVLAPDHVQEWIERWGPVAKPLLWSHAEYLNLLADLAGPEIHKGPFPADGVNRAAQDPGVAEP